MKSWCRINTSSIMSRVGMETYRGGILPHCWAQSSMYCFCISKCSNSIRPQSSLWDMRCSSNYDQDMFYKDINNSRISPHWKARERKILESIIWHKLCHFIGTIRFSTSDTSNYLRFHIQCRGTRNPCTSSFEILDKTRSYSSVSKSELIQSHSSLMRTTKCSCCLAASKEMSKMNKKKMMCIFHNFISYNA